MTLIEPGEPTTTRGTPTDHELEVTVRRQLEEFYRSGPPPWDCGVTPPELVDLVEGTAALPPGRALELGCGTGTNAVYLARHGWDVVGVDLIDCAIRQAQHKAEAVGTPVQVLCGDATRLDDVDVTGSFDLFFDLSCYCGIPAHRRTAYADGLTRRAAPGAWLLMFGYGPEAFDDDIIGVTADELHTRFTGWNLAATTPGTNAVPTFWFLLQRGVETTAAHRHVVGYPSPQ
ncbi:MAG: class I SAM-dependent methyltransferase [Pseudonocardia sp.]|nr:class I SAM-dependent methyltransferase [Pseudonocardia sp.]